MATSRNGSVRKVQPAVAVPTAEPVSQADLQAQIDALKAQNAELKAQVSVQRDPNALTFKVSQPNPEKGVKGGGLSCYGLGRFPLTLYPEQWIRLLGHKEQIIKMIEAHKSELTWKA